MGNKKIDRKEPIKDAALNLSFASWYHGTYQQTPVQSHSVEHTSIESLRSLANQVLTREIERYRVERKKKGLSSDEKWLSTVMRSGTLGDRMSAMALQIQEEPLYGLELLESLISMSKKKGRRESLMAIDTLRDLFLNSILPDRKLKHFGEQPLGAEVDNVHLAYWIFEDRLKSCYEEFIETVTKGTQDTVLQFKEKAIKTLYDLLAKCELEHRILSSLINKLGDTSKQVASKVAYLLSCLVKNRPNMKMQVTKEVEVFLFRPNVGPKPQHYGIIFLNQLLLSRHDQQLAIKLIHLYFSLFKINVDKGEVDSKMLDDLLTGINRAFPFAPYDNSLYNDHINALFKILHIATFNKSVQAIQLLYQFMIADKKRANGSTKKDKKKPEESGKDNEPSSSSLRDRFYRALYEKLLAKDLRTTSKHATFFSILYKACSSDTNLNRVKAFIKRLLQVAAYLEPNVMGAALLLVSQLMTHRPELTSILAHPEVQDDEEEHYEDIKDGSESSSATLPSASQDSRYDPFKRDPQYSNANFTCLWELIAYSRHYHPSVNVFAKQILATKEIEYAGDPLQDFSQSNFLDRFVYKNPKSKQEKPQRPHLMNTKKKQAGYAVNDPTFLAKSEEEIPEQELFFYKYFKQHQKTAKKKPKKAEEDKEDLIDEAMAENTGGDEGGIPSDGESENEDFGAFDEDEDSDMEDTDTFDSHMFDDDEDVQADLDDEDAAPGSSFADAEEFAHLLESSSVEHANVHRRQLAWENKANKGKFGKRKGNQLNRKFSKKSKK